MNDHDTAVLFAAREEAEFLRLENQRLDRECQRLSDLYEQGKKDWKANRPEVVYVTPPPPPPESVNARRVEVLEEQVNVLTDRYLDARQVVVRRDIEIKRLRQAIEVVRAEGNQPSDEKLYFLDERERTIVERRNQGQTLAAIAHAEGLSKEYVRQIDAKARRKMAHPARRCLV